MNIIPLMQQGFAGSSKRLIKIAESFSDDEIFFRPYDKVNHLKWEMGHLTSVRNMLISLLAADVKLEEFPNE